MIVQSELVGCRALAFLSLRIVIPCLSTEMQYLRFLLKETLQSGSRILEAGSGCIVFRENHTSFFNLHVPTLAKEYQNKGVCKVILC